MSLKRARDLAATPFDGSIPLFRRTALRDPRFRRLGATIRFKTDKPLLGQGGGQLPAWSFFISGISTSARWSSTCCATASRPPIPYATNLFDYGRTKVDNTLPINLGLSPAFDCVFQSMPRTSGTR